MISVSRVVDIGNIGWIEVGVGKLFVLRIVMKIWCNNTHNYNALYVAYRHRVHYSHLNTYGSGQACDRSNTARRARRQFSPEHFLLTSKGGTRTAKRKTQIIDNVGGRTRGNNRGGPRRRHGGWA